jgi:D-serine deaminase-like pyridoxal phosphate-dependent protein
MRSAISRRAFVGSAATGAVGVSLLGGRPVSGAEAYDPIPLDAPKSLWDLPTPALVVDEEALEHNLDKMAAFYRDRAAGLRPHAKTHKCPILARKQLEGGAIGICTAKVSEAEVMVEAGVENVLITSPVVTKDKIGRVIALAKGHPGVAIVVDQAQNVGDLNDAAAASGMRLQVLVDLNVGTDRTGITMGRPAIDLVEKIHRSSALEFGGLQAYAGHLQHLNGWDYRRQASEKAMGGAADLKREVEKAGFDVPVLSGGGTGTYNIDSEVEGVSDVQVGSYLFMDVNYRNIGGEGGPVFDDFRPSLLVLATAISQPTKGRITIDAGYKAFATDHEAPVLRDIEGVTYRWAGDEHGILQFKDPSREIKVGDKVLLIASHCDPTVNLYDHCYPFRGGTVKELWPIGARGRSQ